MRVNIYWSIYVIKVSNDCVATADSYGKFTPFPSGCDSRATTSNRYLLPSLKRRSVYDSAIPEHRRMGFLPAHGGSANWRHRYGMGRTKRVWNGLCDHSQTSKTACRRRQHCHCGIGRRPALNDACSAHSARRSQDWHARARRNRRWTGRQKNRRF